MWLRPQLNFKMSDYSRKKFTEVLTLLENGSAEADIVDVTSCEFSASRGVVENDAANSLTFQRCLWQADGTQQVGAFKEGTRAGSND